MGRIGVFFTLAAVTIATTFALWLPFIFRLEKFWGIPLSQAGMATIVANFDGPYYIVAAKTLYDPKSIEQNFSFPLPAIYYSAHYPLFPLLIRGAATVFPFLSYPYAMIGVTVITTVAAVYLFYLLLEQAGLKKHALWLSLLFTIFPARWFITRSVGSPEPLFLFLIMAAVYFFQKGKWLSAGLFGVLAQWTKAPGILLFISFTVAILAANWPQLAKIDAAVWIKKLPWRAYPIALIPLSLVALFLWYGQRYGNFLAYFNSGDNIHLMFPPFGVFNPAQVWVGTFWLEEVIWIYLFGALGVVQLVKQRRLTMASFVAVFFLSILFVSHRDIARYSLPIVPFLFVAFSNVLSNTAFRWIMLILVIPIYLFSVAFITNNVTPISDWTPLL